MHLIFRLASSLLLASLFLLAIRPAEAAQAMQWIDREHVVVCPARAGDDAPPDFSAPDCRRTSFSTVDSQHATLWLKASITLSPAMRDQVAPLGLFVSGKAASIAWVNGQRIGSNGQPGMDAGSETPGRMDVVIPIPSGVLKAGANEIALKLSGHHGFIRLANPLHLLALGTYAEPADQILRTYWPALITGGVFLLGLLYYGVSALRGRDRTGSWVLSLISLFAIGQLLAEASRGLLAYRYPLHDVRLVVIVLCSLGFGSCLSAHVIRRFRPHRPVLAFAATALPTLTAVMLIDSYDGKATAAMLGPVLLCALGIGLQSWRREPGALAYFVCLASFAALSFLLGGHFLDIMFFYLVAALLLFLFAQQASVLASEQQLRIALSSRAQQLQAALDHARARSQPPAKAQKIRIIDTGKIALVSVDQITHCSGAGDYVELNFVDGGKRLHGGSLNDLEAEFPPAFIRVHRSHIVNTAFVESLERDPSGVGRLRISTGEWVPVSRRIMPTVRRAISATEGLVSQ